MTYDPNQPKRALADQAVPTACGHGLTKGLVSGWLVATKLRDFATPALLGRPEIKYLEKCFKTRSLFILLRIDGAGKPAPKYSFLSTRLLN